MAQAIKGAASRLAGSTTFWYGAGACAAWEALSQYGYEPPMWLVGLAVGGYSLKESAKYLASRKA